MMDERDRVYLEHILECIALIQTYTRSSKVEFLLTRNQRDFCKVSGLVIEDWTV